MWLSQWVNPFDPKPIKYVNKTVWDSSRFPVLPVLDQEGSKGATPSQHAAGHPLPQHTRARIPKSDER